MELLHERCAAATSLKFLSRDGALLLSLQCFAEFCRFSF